MNRRAAIQSLWSAAPVHCLLGCLPGVRETSKRPSDSEMKAIEIIGRWDLAP